MDTFVLLIWYSWVYALPFMWIACILSLDDSDHIDQKRIFVSRCLSKVHAFDAAERSHAGHNGHRRHLHVKQLRHPSRWAISFLKISSAFTLMAGAICVDLCRIITMDLQVILVVWSMSSCDAVAVFAGFAATSIDSLRGLTLREVLDSLWASWTRLTYESSWMILTRCPFSSRRGICYFGQTANSSTAFPIWQSSRIGRECGSSHYASPARRAISVQNPFQNFE